MISEVYPRHREDSAHFTRYNIPEVMSIIDEIVKSFTNDKELEEIEKKYYTELKNAWLKYVDSRRLVPHLDKVSKILLSLKNRLLPIKNSLLKP